MIIILSKCTKAKTGFIVEFMDIYSDTSFKTVPANTSKENLRCSFLKRHLKKIFEYFLQPLKISTFTNNFVHEDKICNPWFSIIKDGRRH